MPDDDDDAATTLTPLPMSAPPPPPPSMPAAWMPDPMRRFDLRYWDGVRWTDHSIQGVDPL
jgi:hypothetical protein